MPIPNNWFSPNVEYEGQGCAEFSDPRLTLEGYVKIKFDEFGYQNIEMNVDDVDIGFPFEVVTTNFVHKLVVTTSNGMFSANEGILCNGISLSYGPQGQALLKFHVNHSQFDVNEVRTARYWVLPLSNFISKFMPHGISKLDRHPLRIYPTPVIPEGLSDDNSNFAIHIAANKNNRLISFRFNGGLGFIEKLADYKERKSRLFDGNERSITTAVMVCEIGTKPINNFVDLEKWFPFYFLSLLGFATGIEVGAPWIEFRDSNGELVRRIHSNLRRPCFSEGHRVIDEIHHHETGLLLTQSQYTLHQKSHLNVILSHIICGSNNNIFLDDRMCHIFRAFDCLAEEYKVDATYLMSSLDKKYKKIIESILDSASNQISDVTTGVTILDRKNQIAILEEIANRTKSTPANKSKPTGFKIEKLLKIFGLPDAGIVNKYYQEKPRQDGIKTWESVLNVYRNDIIHTSYLDFHIKNYEHYDSVRVWKHLHDILIRIVLKMLCYDGTYQRAVLIPGDWKASWPVDWVKPDTPASELGY